MTLDRIKQTLAHDGALTPPGAWTREVVAWLVGEVDRLTGLLAQCYRATGADPDGNDDRHLAPHALDAVQELRREHGDVLETAATYELTLNRVGLLVDCDRLDARLVGAVRARLATAGVDVVPMASDKPRPVAAPVREASGPRRPNVSGLPLAEAAALARAVADTHEAAAAAQQARDAERPDGTDPTDAETLHRWAQVLRTLAAAVETTDAAIARREQEAFVKGAEWGDTDSRTPLTWAAKQDEARRRYPTGGAPQTEEA